MARKVFWSWQSDQPARVTRNLVREALQAALQRISVEIEDAERPELDHDTKGVPGIPDIPATILRKIEEAAVFVADLTPIAVSSAGKQVANPNVLIELGYAKRALGTDRLILVWNTALTGATVEDLPFDLRHRRGPLSYSLDEGCSTNELRIVRADLTERLVQALADTLRSAPAAPAPALLWHLSEPTEPSIWNDYKLPLRVNTDTPEGTKISFAGTPRAYARVVPTHWSRAEDAFATLHSGVRNPIPLGRYQQLDWGATRGGFVVFRTSPSIRVAGMTPSATRWFRESGEFWGVDSSAFTPVGDRLFFSCGYAAECLMSWLKHNSALVRQLGGSGALQVRMGLDGITDTCWGGVSGKGSPAVEEAVRYEFVLPSEDKEIELEVQRFINLTREAYGLAPLRLSS